MTEKKSVSFISTGEAAKLLGVCRDTIVNYFDQGLLTGRKNPLTYRRSVNKESVLALIKRSRNWGGER